MLKDQKSWFSPPIWKVSWLVPFFSSMLKVLFYFADICQRGVKPAFRSFSLFVWATSLQHSIPIPHLHIIKSCLLFLNRIARWIQLADVLCAEFFYVPISKWRIDAGCCFFVAKYILECLNSSNHTCEFSLYIRQLFLAAPKTSCTQLSTFLELFSFPIFSFYLVFANLMIKMHDVSGGNDACSRLFQNPEWVAQTCVDVSIIIHCFPHLFHPGVCIL